MNKPKKIIITGGPGSGKTAIILGLEEKGFSVIQEKAREVIKNQQLMGGQKLPWKDILGFSDLVLEEMQNTVFSDRLYFLDRSSIDVEAYLQVAKISYNNLRYATINTSMGFYKKVFFAPHWHDIYITDQERKETALEAEKISKKIKQVYIQYGFDLVEIPKISVEKRVEFILSELNLEM